MEKNIRNPVIKNYAYCLAHAPDLVQHGSKPRREIEQNPEAKRRIMSSLRQYRDAAGYAPNQVFIGNMWPEDLRNIERPWYKKENLIQNPSPIGEFGEIINQRMFYALLKLADIIEPPLFAIGEEWTDTLLDMLKSHFLFQDLSINQFKTISKNNIKMNLAQNLAIPIFDERLAVGCFNRDNRSEGAEDENLTAHHLLENLCAKASGALALKWLLYREDMDPGEVDYILSCGEEACGDRYQRGGGGMAKAIGEMCGCVNASGHDTKNFCTAPANAIITAAAYVKSGLYDNVAVVGGGSLAKLGMKMRGFLDSGIFILDDCLASIAFLVSRNDGKSPIIQLKRGAVGKARIGASTSDEAVYRELILKPLKTLKLKMSDIDKFAPELQNPEIMEHAGSGDVAKKNYRKIAAMAVIAEEIGKKDMNNFIDGIGMPGFAPTQGHIPSAVPYLGHAVEAMKQDKIKRAMFVGKASLFLSRCTTLFDGVSFILERNKKK